MSLITQEKFTYCYKCSKKIEEYFNSIDLQEFIICNECRVISPPSPSFKPCPMCYYPCILWYESNHKSLFGLRTRKECILHQYSYLDIAMNWFTEE